jgi:hypothetical protein
MTTGVQKAETGMLTVIKRIAQRLSVISKLHELRQDSQLQA